MSGEVAESSFELLEAIAAVSVTSATFVDASPLPSPAAHNLPPATSRRLIPQPPPAVTLDGYLAAIVNPKSTSRVKGGKKKVKRRAHSFWIKVAYWCLRFFRRMMRGVQRSRGKRVEGARRQRAAFVIQCCYRNYCQRRRVRRRIAAGKIAGHIKKRLDKELQRRHKAATLIQKEWRGKLGRDIAKRLLFEKTFTTVLRTLRAKAQRVVAQRRLNYLRSLRAEREIIGGQCLTQLHRITREECEGWKAILGQATSCIPGFRIGTAKPTEGATTDSQSIHSGATAAYILSPTGRRRQPNTFQDLASLARALLLQPDYSRYPMPVVTFVVHVESAKDPSQKQGEGPQSSDRSQAAGAVSGLSLREQIYNSVQVPFSSLKETVPYVEERGSANASPIGYGAGLSRQPKDSPKLTVCGSPRELQLRLPRGQAESSAGVLPGSGVRHREGSSNSFLSGSSGSGSEGSVRPFQLGRAASQPVDTETERIIASQHPLPPSAEISMGFSLCAVDSQSLSFPTQSQLASSQASNGLPSVPFPTPDWNSSLLLSITIPDPVSGDESVPSYLQNTATFRPSQMLDRVQDNAAASPRSEDPDLDPVSPLPLPPNHSAASTKQSPKGGLPPRAVGAAPSLSLLSTGGSLSRTASGLSARSGRSSRSMKRSGSSRGKTMRRYVLHDELELEFARLLEVTEANERKVLQTTILTAMKIIYEKLGFLRVMEQEKSVTPPHLAHLLRGFTLPWTLRRARTLLQEESEARAKIIAEYEHTPIIDLNRRQGRKPRSTAQRFSIGSRFASGLGSMSSGSFLSGQSFTGGSFHATGVFGEGSMLGGGEDGPFPSAMGARAHSPFGSFGNTLSAAVTPSNAGLSPSVRGGGRAAARRSSLQVAMLTERVLSDAETYGFLSLDASNPVDSTHHGIFAQQAPPGGHNRLRSRDGSDGASVAFSQREKALQKSRQLSVFNHVPTLVTTLPSFVQKKGSSAAGIVKKGSSLGGIGREARDEDTMSVASGSSQPPPMQPTMRQRRSISGGEANALFPSELGMASPRGSLGRDSLSSDAGSGYSPASVQLDLPRQPQDSQAQAGRGAAPGRTTLFGQRSSSSSRTVSSVIPLHMLLREGSALDSLPSGSNRGVVGFSASGLPFTRRDSSSSTPPLPTVEAPKLHQYVSTRTSGSPITALHSAFSFMKAESEVDPEASQQPMLLRGGGGSSVFFGTNHSLNSGATASSSGKDFTFGRESSGQKLKSAPEASGPFTFGYAFDSGEESSGGSRTPSKGDLLKAD